MPPKAAAGRKKPAPKKKTATQLAAEAQAELTEKEYQWAQQRVILQHAIHAAQHHLDAVVVESEELAKDIERAEREREKRLADIDAHRTQHRRASRVTQHKLREAREHSTLQRQTIRDVKQSVSRDRHHVTLRQAELEQQKQSPAEQSAARLEEWMGSVRSRLLATRRVECSVAARIAELEKTAAVSANNALPDAALAGAAVVYVGRPVPGAAGHLLGAALSQQVVAHVLGASSVPPPKHSVGFVHVLGEPQSSRTSLHPTDAVLSMACSSTSRCSPGESVGIHVSRLLRLMLSLNEDPGASEHTSGRRRGRLLFISGSLVPGTDGVLDIHCGPDENDCCRIALADLVGAVVGVDNGDVTLVLDVLPSAASTTQRGWSVLLSSSMKGFARVYRHRAELSGMGRDPVPQAWDGYISALVALVLDVAAGLHSDKEEDCVVVEEEEDEEDTSGRIKENKTVDSEEDTTAGIAVSKAALFLVVDNLVRTPHVARQLEHVGSPTLWPSWLQALSLQQTGSSWDDENNGDEVLRFSSTDRQVLAAFGLPAGVDVLLAARRGVAVWATRPGQRVDLMLHEALALRRSPSVDVGSVEEDAMHGGGEEPDVHSWIRQALLQHPLRRLVVDAADDRDVLRGFSSEFQADEDEVQLLQLVARRNAPLPFTPAEVAAAMSRDLNAALRGTRCAAGGSVAVLECRTVTDGVTSSTLFEARGTSGLSPSEVHRIISDGVPECTVRRIRRRCLTVRGCHGAIVAALFNATFPCAAGVPLLPPATEEGNQENGGSGTAGGGAADPTRLESSSSRQQRRADPGTMWVARLGPILPSLCQEGQLGACGKIGASIPPQLSQSTRLHLVFGGGATPLASDSTFVSAQRRAFDAGVDEMVRTTGSLSVPMANAIIGFVADGTLGLDLEGPLRDGCTSSGKDDDGPLFRKPSTLARQAARHEPSETTAVTAQPPPTSGTRATHPVALVARGGLRAAMPADPGAYVELRRRANTVPGTSGAFRAEVIAATVHHWLASRHEFAPLDGHVGV